MREQGRWAAVGRACALAAGVWCAARMAHAVTGTGETPSYWYHRQRVDLGVDATRLALRAPDDARESAPPLAALGAAGLGVVSVRAHEVKGWWIADLAPGLKTEEIGAAVGRAGAAAPGWFVSPVYLNTRDQTPVLIVPDIFVRFVDAIGSDAAAGAIATVPGIRVVERDWNRMPGVFRIRASRPDAIATLEAAAALAAVPGVAFAEPDRVVTAQEALIPNDTGFSNCWGLRNIGQSGGLFDADMNATEAWDVTTGDPGVGVLIMDRGIQYDHPDINCFPGNDFSNSGADFGYPVHECDNHGTCVAGCVSAKINNNRGTVGVAPNTRTVPAKVGVANPAPCTGSFSTQMSWFVDALTWAEEHGIRITNASLAASPFAPLDQKYTETRGRGMIHFAAAGNNGTAGIGYPATSPAVTAVGAVDRHGNIADFSQWGSQMWVSAPGVEVYTIDRVGSAGYVSGDYTTVDGTSFASPYAAGVAALVLSKNPTLTAAEVENALADSAWDANGGGWDEHFGYGVVQADGSLAQVAAVTRPANDGCSGAQVLTPNSSISGSNLLARFDGDSSCTWSTHDLWYSFTPTLSGPVTFSTCGSGFDTTLAVFSGSCTALSELACNDDAGAGPCASSIQSYISLNLTAGTRYFVRVAGYYFNAGALMLTTTGGAAAPPANDACANAATLTTGVAATGTTASATTDGPVACALDNGTSGKDVWFSLTPGAAGTVTLNACASSFDTVLSAYTGSCASLTQVACNDDATTGPCSGATRSYVTFSGAAGTRYLIRLAGWGTSAASLASGAYSLTATFTAGCPADTDGLNGLTVGDLFLFLQRWFALLPSADFNGVNGVTLQDLFDYLVAYFTGCP